MAGLPACARRVTRSMNPDPGARGGRGCSVASRVAVAGPNDGTSFQRISFAATVALVGSPDSASDGHNRDVSRSDHSVTTSERSVSSPQIVIVVQSYSQAGGEATRSLPAPRWVGRAPVELPPASTSLKRGSRDAALDSHHPSIRVPGCIGVPPAGLGSREAAPTLVAGVLPDLIAATIRTALSASLPEAPIVIHGEDDAP
jgi:hypothetical protein